MTGEGQLLLWIAGVHLLGLALVAALMIPALRDHPDGPGGQSDADSDDGWGNNPRGPHDPPRVPGGGIPLPDAQPSSVRLRDHRRLTDHRSGRGRRPVREPVRLPARSPHSEARRRERCR